MGSRCTEPTRGSRSLILLDTLVLIWSDRGPERLGRRARSTIDRSECVFSAVTMWEVARLVAGGRLRLDQSVARWRDALIGVGVLELALTGPVGIRAAELVGLHQDPADRLIAATAIVHGIPLLTADQRLLDWDGPGERIDARQ